MGEMVVNLSDLRQLGSDACIFLSFIRHLQEAKQAAWVQLSRDEIQEMTRMVRRRQETARKKLRAAGLLAEKYDRLNHHKFYSATEVKP